jgi:hypothetical protein
VVLTRLLGFVRISLMVVLPGQIAAAHRVYCGHPSAHASAFVLCVERRA